SAALAGTIIDGASLGFDILNKV
nr:RecName: Full=Magnificalysin II; Short=HMg II; AltName: Full=Cytolysin II; AltName: Full=DELTA-stichotoxin [Heteractis magnifica]